MVCGQIWPDGTFGISVLDRKFNLQQALSPRKRSTDEETFQRSCALHGLIPSLEVWGKTVNGMDILNNIAEGKPASTLGSSIVANSHRLPRGQNGISSNARLLVRNGALLLQRLYGNKHLSFLTLTLPTTSTADNQRITEKWSEIVRVFIQWLGRRLRSHGLDGEIVGCVEIQEERSEWQEGILGLHLHLVFRGRLPYKAWVMKPGDIREEWAKCIKNVLPITGEGYYYGAVENLQPVRKDAGRYLGKYLSKGIKAVLRFKTLYPDHRLPSCWSVCTSALRHAVKACKMASAATASIVQEMIESGRAECFATLHSATFIGADGKEHICGWYGFLSDMGRSAVGLDRHVKMRVSALHKRRAETTS